MYKNFPKLRALDGYRKAVEMENMRDALPKEQEETVSYSVEHVQWFDEAELLKKNPEKSRFEDTTDHKLQENTFASLLKECKAVLDKKTNVLQL